MRDPEDGEAFDFMSPEDVAEIQEQLATLEIRAARIDLDGFLKVAEAIQSPQALAAGIDPRAVTSAATWVEMARLLKPFWDHAVERVEANQRERREGAFG